MMSRLKRLLVVSAIPLLALALTACPGPDDNGADVGEPTIEGELEDVGEEVEEGVENAGEAVEQGVEDFGQEAEELREALEESEDDATP